MYPRSEVYFTESIGNVYIMYTHARTHAHRIVTTAANDCVCIRACVRACTHIYRERERGGRERERERGGRERNMKKIIDINGLKRSQ